MMTFEKVLEVFNDYLNKDSEVIAKQVRDMSPNSAET